MVHDALVPHDEFIDNEDTTYIVIIAQPSEIVAKLVDGHGITPDFNYFIFHRSVAGYWVDRDDPRIVIKQIV